MNPTLPTIAPKATDISRPFWDACRQHRLSMQQCQGCGKHVFYPAYMCPHCSGLDLQWRQLGGRGTVHTFTVVHHPAAEVFARSTPYVVALVQVAEGPFMMSNIVGENCLETRVGDEVEVQFEDFEDVTLPRFRLVNR